MNSRISIEELEDATAFMAWLVQEHGNVYRPIFERLHKEYEARKRASDQLEVMAAMAELKMSKKHTAQPIPSYALTSPHDHI